MHTQPSASFGVLLRHYRQRAALTQEALAEQAGLTPNAISALERGERRHPYPTTVHALATALQLEAQQRDLLLRLAQTKAQGLQTIPPTEMPALMESIAQTRARQPHRTALPAAPNALIGREEQHAAIVAALLDPACHLVTLVGPGGAGKTRLALEVASSLAGQFADGVFWVALAPVAAADSVAVAIATALQHPLHGAAPPAAQVLDLLRDRDMLLVLDNMEHVLAAADLVATLLEHAPKVRWLVTSRERLRLAGEWVIDVPGLALPDAQGVEDGAHAAAVRLFEVRARQVMHQFAVTEANQRDVTRICRLVEGMPLGIELAAAWIGTLTVAEIADEIGRNLDFLHLADRNAPARHRSLRAVFDHSWNLLTAEERQVLARLAVFRGGCDRAAAEEVAGATLPLLAALLDKSLIRRELDSTGPRYGLHELLRQYALAQLEADPDEAARTRDRHCAYYARQLGERTGAFLNGAAPVANSEVAPDLDNLRLAWARAVQQRDHRLLAQMAHSMQVICEVRGLFEEGVALFRDAASALKAELAAVSTTAPASDPELVWTLGHIVSLYGNRAARCGHFGEARNLLHEAYALLEQRSDLLLHSGTLAWLGYMAYVLGAYEEARGWLTRNIQLSRAHGDTFFLARSESILALVAQAQGAHKEALALAQAGVDDWRANGHPCSLAMGLWVASDVLLTQGAAAHAEEAAREGLHLGAWLQDPWSTGAALLQLGTLALGRGEPVEARTMVEESLSIFTQLGDPWSRGRALIALGRISQAQDRREDAREQFERALNIARATELDPLVLEAQYGLASLMGEDTPAAALAFLDQIIAHPAAEHRTRERALHLQGQVRAAERRTSATQHQVAGLHVATTGETLTPREMDVLRLLAHGRSNQAIAHELIVAVGTVKRHVNSILGKLQTQNRLEAVTRARDLDLV